MNFIQYLFFRWWANILIRLTRFFFKSIVQIVMFVVFWPFYIGRFLFQVLVPLFVALLRIVFLPVTIIFSVVFGGSKDEKVKKKRRR